MPTTETKGHLALVTYHIPFYALLAVVADRHRSGAATHQFERAHLPAFSRGGASTGSENVVNDLDARALVAAR